VRGCVWPVLLFTLAAAGNARAATFVVDRSDAAVAMACTPAPNDCSLPGGAAAANAAPDHDVIQLPEGTFPKEIAFNQPTTLRGSGAAVTRLSGTGAMILNDATFIISDLTITGGDNAGPAYGGGLYIAGSANVTLRRVAVVGNTDGAHTGSAQLYPAWGGGVFINGTDSLVLIEDSLIAGNTADVADNGTLATGAGIETGGALTVRNSTITGNRVIGGSKPASGAGIDARSAQPLILDHVTLAGNEAVGGSPVTGVNLSTTANTLVIVEDSIIGGALPQGVPNCSRPVTDTRGGNVENRDDCGFGAADLRQTAPLLGTLADNGGPTQTLALDARSPAIDFAGTCALAADQRGQPRAFGACDSGAFELIKPAPPATPQTPPATTQAPPATTTPAPPVCSVRLSGNAKTLKATLRCRALADVTLRTRAQVTYKKPKRGARPKPRSFALKQRATAVSGARATVLTLAVPAAVRNAAKAGHTVKVIVDAVATSVAGATSKSSGTLARLRPAPAKPRR
jgi:hypothetical protein